MALSLLQELTGFHGSGKNLKRLKPPIFVALNKQEAEWYAGDRDGYILKGEIVVSNALDARDPDVMLEYADKAGIEYTDDGQFFCAEIAEHSVNEGDNINDLVYIPSFVKAVKKAGHDSIRTMDVLESDMIEIYILLDSKQFKVTGSDKHEPRW